ncbi:MAG: xanthine dehydrogenase family protein molybdopterin-binding subunit, partial [Acidobacteria bacterium]|nr:xanthine dehydrogenase family protein molybdopterin-binding subunit [Acidobacteriota bacterium]
MGKWTRRAFIGAGSLVGGGFVLGVAGITLAPGRHCLVSADAAEKGELTTWITVTPDNFTTILVPHCEMGQGSQTALAMMAAEEMEADWDLVRIEEAPALDAYANAYLLRAFTGDPFPAPLGRAIDYGAYRLASWFGTQVTGGSMAVRGTGFGMCIAGAAAKEMLLEAAAERFGVPVSECTADASRVTHAASGQSASFGELARAATAIPVPPHPALKDPDTYSIRRTARKRFDIPPKVDGSVTFGIDFTLPGMLHAAVDIAPVQGGKLVTVDPGPAENMPGVKQVVQLEEAVAVVADSYWQARQALGRLSPEYDDAGHGDVSSASIFAAFDESLGDPPDMPADAATVISADYRVPFLAHATMEPMACTARVEGDQAEVWAGTQDPLNARSMAASALDFDASQVKLTNLPLGGGYGRRLPFTFDYVQLAVRIARAASPAPVKLVWSRENDIQPDFYRPAAMSRFAGALDGQGRPLAVASYYAGGGNAEAVFMPYAIADRRDDARDAPHHVRTGEWRSVLNSQHGFFKESFIDELAHAAGKDPYRFRRDLLGERPRFRAALDRAAAMSDWDSPLPAGEGRGIAICESFGTIVAQVAHVAVSPAGELRVRRVWAAVDCGDVVNTDTAAAQMEGGVIFALSATMVGEITIAGGRIAESNFRDHQMIRMADAPDVQVEFIRSNAWLGGLGEPSVPPLAPAVTNAIYAATGIRVRDLPIKNQDLSRA